MVTLKDIVPFTKNLSLLYIEENQETLVKNVEELRKVFYRVDDASDATMGIGYIKLNTYDIVLLDSDSTIMNTNQLVKNIRQKNKFQDIVITTKESSNNALLSLYSLHVNAIIQKPFSLNILVDILGALAERIVNSRGSGSNDLEQLKADLLYERKRIGRFMLNEKKLNEKLHLLEKKQYLDKNIYELTSLPNRHALQTAINGKIQSLMYINIDHFDFVNSIYGMGKANKLLRETASRLNKFLPKNGELFHVTADEFVILLDTPSKNQDILLAQQIQSLFKEAPVEFENHAHYVVFSIGIDRGEGKQLFINAKSASKEAKYFGGDQNVLYDSQSYYMKKQRENYFWINILKKAFEEDKIFIFFQPILSNYNEETKHYEVLCRLMDDQKRFINAEKFINSAKLVGFITQITKTVIDKAFKVFTKNNYNFSINISMYDLHENYLLDFLEYKCQRYNIIPSRIHLEIIEDIIVVNLASIDRQITTLREKGFGVIIDDFSTEKSLYNRIFDLNAQFIKIDGSFTRGMKKENAHYIAVKGIVEFAKKSGIKTIAEHIETQEVYDMIKELGVDYSQGYFLSKPSSKLE